VHVWFGWRRRHFEVGMYNEMMVPLSDISTVDDVALRWWENFMEDGGVMDGCLSTDAALTGAWDTLWDCACAVRPYSDGKEA
jgi:hypothetical protein